MSKKEKKQETDKPSYYAIIPSEVRYAKIPHLAKLLYGEITCLSNVKGYCFATDNHFAELYEVSRQTINNHFRVLKDNGFIRVETKKSYLRKIYMAAKDIKTQESLQGCQEKFTPPCQEKFTHNNTRVNNIKNNTAPAVADGNFSVQKQKRTYIMKLAYDFMAKHGVPIINNAVFQKQIMNAWGTNGDRKMLELLVFLRDCYDDYKKDDFTPQISDYLDITRKNKSLLDLAEKKRFEFEPSDYADFSKNGFDNI